MFLALHVPDGFIDGATSAAIAGVALGSVGVALRVVGRRLMDESLALAGLVAAFVFAAQMVNFPVAAGTSGHLVGGALAAILVGPAAAVVIMSSVIVVQSLLFADGGLTALGINVLNMGILAPLAAWLLFRTVIALAGARRDAVIPATAIAAWASVVVASLGFTVQYAVGGRGGAPAGVVLAGMVGVHSVIGIGEAFITVVVVRAVIATRPDLVLLARSTDPSGTLLRRRPVGMPFVAVGFTAAVMVAVGVSQFASGAPDGLERVAIDSGFDDAAAEHALADGALAGYGSGVRGEAAGTALSGLTGTIVVSIVAVALLGLVAAVVRRGRAAAPTRPSKPTLEAEV